MASVTLSSTYKTSNLGKGAQLKINYTAAYDKTTNETTVTIDSVQAYNESILLQMKVHGQLTCNGEIVADFDNDNVSLKQSTWVTISGGVYTPVTFKHSIDGALTLTFKPKTVDTTYPGYGGSRAGLYIGGNSGGNYSFTFGETAEAVADAAVTPTTYKLAVTAGTGSSITVSRASSPWGGDTGALSTGAVLYYGDVLQISFEVSTGYNLETTTVNGESFTSGSSLTVSGAVSVAATATVKSYVLSIAIGGHSAVTVNRTSSPLKGEAAGELADGSVIYYNDVLEIVVVIPGGYSVEQQTINGSAFASGDSHTVTADVIIVVVTESSGTANIGGALYQIGIAKDGVINLYVAGVAKDGAFHILS